MNIIAVIPARKGSQRLKNKNILPLLGKPVINYTIEAALQAKLIKRVIVSTDGEEIARISKEAGAEIIWRPNEISTSTAALDDAVRHVVKQLDAMEGYHPDIVVILHANVPFRDKEAIDKSINMLLETNADSIASAYEITQRPEWMKRIIDGRAVPYQPPTNHFRTQDLENLYLLDGAIITTKVESLMKTEGDKKVHAYLGNDIRLIIQDIKYTVEIDTADDLKFAEALMRSQSPEDDK